jgi:hypothetical protein
MTIPFEFDEERHLYIVPGREVLSTSDVLALNGLCDYSTVPSGVLEHAAWRGTQLHKAIHYFEEDDLEIEDVPEEVMPYFLAYLKFRNDKDFQVEKPCERGIVYEHESGQLIGCHLDLVGTIRGQRYIVDIKSSHPNSGKAKKQTHFRWKMQLASYAQALGETAETMVVHVHKTGEYTPVDFLPDGSEMWFSMVQVAAAKLANGYKRPEK